MSLPIIWPVDDVVDTGVVVGITSTLVIAANPKRADAEFVNDSDVVIYLARGHDAVLNKGIRLNASGGSYSINNRNLFLGAIYAIRANVQDSDKNLTVSEGSWK